MKILGMAAMLLAAAWLDAAPAGDSVKQDLERQLQARYVPVKLGPGGRTVVSPGTILTVQVPGIRSNPATQFTFMNTYQGGQIKHSAGSTLITDRNAVQDLQVGEGVFLYKVEVKDNGVVLHVQACGNCDFSVVDPLPFRAGITFQLPKNWLQSPDLNRVDQLIGQVFSIVGAAPAAATPASGSPAPAPAPPPVSPAQQQPVRIALGQTLEQVRSLLGEPAKVVDLGSKKIFVYKDLKITFIDAKVTGVE